MRCKVCLGADVKNAILKDLPGLKDILGKIPDCPAPREVTLCGRAGRARSAYTEFVAECMRGKKIKSFGEAPAAMRACAAEWRARK